MPPPPPAWQDALLLAIAVVLIGASFSLGLLLL
jgi:hypothetical protein